MRHQDANLTALNYTDANLLPTFDAVASLTWEGKAPAYTHGDIQRTGAEGQNGSQAGTENGWENPDETIANRGQSHVLTLPVTKLKMAERGGFEPPIPFKGYTGLANQRLQPLGHLSVRPAIIGCFWLFYNFSKPPRVDFGQHNCNAHTHESYPVAQSQARGKLTPRRAIRLLVTNSDSLKIC